MLYQKLHLRLLYSITNYTKNQYFVNIFSYILLIINNLKTLCAQFSILTFLLKLFGCNYEYCSYPTKNI